MPQNRPIDLQDQLHGVSACDEVQPSETSHPEVASLGQPGAILHLSNLQSLRPQVINTLTARKIGHE